MDYKQIEAKWQKKWAETGIYKFDSSKVDKKYYCLEMFSYPSGAKLHAGHWYNYGPADTFARFKRMQGYEVFQPMGFDAFGLPAENYAIKTGIHPQESTLKNIETMENQLKRIGAMYDWDYEIKTCMPDYYKWTQWMFLQLYKKGLAYRKEAPVNWCPSCNTVLANEQAQGGICERCGSQVTHKNLNQWFLKITAYADELLEGLDKLDWPEKTKLMQKNWIGRSYGGEVEFAVKGKDVTFKVFTTRADTIFGVSYVFLAPESPLVELVVTPEQKEFIVKALREKKHTTAMFGDGVNDILAMKASDVSISVTAGSRAARDIANLVLLNNEFGSLPDIVGQGRRVINNLQRTCSLFLTKTIFSISLNIFFLLFGLFSRNSMAGPILWPFSTNHFYVWELITIGTSSFFLALEPNNERLKGHFLMNIFKKALPSGIIMGCGIVFMFLYSFFTKDLNGNNFNDLVEVSVYYISIASMFVLIQTCYKFNKYRLLVLVYAAVMIALMFLMSIYSDFNLLKLQREIHDLSFVTLLIVVLVVSLILIGINFVIFNRKTLFKKLYEKHGK